MNDTGLPLVPEESMSEISGGTFAYDLGRGLRFLGILYRYPQGMGIVPAVADWYITSCLNS